MRKFAFNGMSALCGRLPFVYLILVVAIASCQSTGQDQQEKAVNESTPVENGIQVVHHPEDSSVTVSVDGQPFTAYIYPEVIKKPVLFPVRTSRGTLVTRGFPLMPTAGERVDHPHHVGVWFNYGDVNGLDFWNNSEAIAEDKRSGYGVIVHREVLETKSGEEQGLLKVAADWNTPEGKKLLDEETTFYFSGTEEVRIIDRVTQLTALEEQVRFDDNKEGVFAIRVTRALEQPADKPQIFTDASGKKTDVPILNNEGVHGQYISSEGLTGDEVWGSRAKWTNLASHIGDEQISIIIMDHPDNVGFPTYWHARGYGLFSANPLGQKEFSDGKETLNFSLQPQESVTFKYRMVIYSGDKPVTKEWIEKNYQTFVSQV